MAKNVSAGRPVQLRLPQGHMSVELEGALRRLRAAIKAVPRQEWQRRENNLRQLERHLTLPSAKSDSRSSIPSRKN